MNSLQTSATKHHVPHSDTPSEHSKMVNLGSCLAFTSVALFVRKLRSCIGWRFGAHYVRLALHLTSTVVVLSLLAADASVSASPPTSVLLVLVAFGVLVAFDVLVGFGILVVGVLVLVAGVFVVVTGVVVVAVGVLVVGVGVVVVVSASLAVAVDELVPVPVRGTQFSTEYHHSQKCRLLATR